MSRFKHFIIYTVCASLLAASLCGFRTAPAAASGGGYIKATMYFGHTWQINFWTGEHAEAEEDFARIREDGFNTIILVIPWRAFQPSLSGGVSQTMLSRLDNLMQRAEAAGLGVMLRVGYTWDMASGDDTIERFNALVSDRTVRTAWKNYAGTIYQHAAQHANYAGGFLTWEDFWNYISRAESAAARGDLMEAQRSGYSAYVLEHYTEEERLALYGNERDAGTAPFPTSDSPAYVCFLEWYDTVLNDLLRETQSVYPGLSLECRLHYDNYYTADGRLEGYSHYRTFAAEDAPYTSAMLSVDMAATSGTSASAVAGTAGSLLGFVRGTAGKPVFVDQFLYNETTPGYEDLAHISDSVGSYLAQMGGVFRDRTMGYGLWTYRDYTDNLIYNPEFGLGLDGWTATAGKVEPVNGNQRMHLQKGGTLTQNLSGRAYLSEKPAQVRMRVRAEVPVTVTVTLGGQTRQQELAPGEQILHVSYDSPLRGSLTIMSSEEIWLDDVQVYSHVTEGGIYDLDGNPGPYLNGLHQLNAAMPD